MTDTLELLENQKQAMEADRAKLDADISDLDAAIKAIKSRRGTGTAKPKPAPKKAATPKKPTPKATAKKPAPKTAAKKPAPASVAKPAQASAAKPEKKSTKKPAVKVTLDEAIIKAVGSGQSTPVMILDFVTGKMSVETTINSIRTRVSRLKREGKLLRGKEGWSLPAS